MVRPMVCDDEDKGIVKLTRRTDVCRLVGSVLFVFVDVLALASTSR